MKKFFLITGSAGFIGFHLSKKLLDKGFDVVGVDNINSYYDKGLKLNRLKLLKKYKNFIFLKLDITNKKKLTSVFKKYNFFKVFNLAAQAGVRYSLKKPEEYIKSNLLGFYNILQLCKDFSVKHLIYASSSSVYGASKKLPFSEKDHCSHPIQLYAATKLSNELMAHSYSSLFNIPTTGIRFFTVYGPWGRPDQALFIFTKKIIEGQKIPVFNFGNHSRDFTYIDDIVEGILKVSSKIPKKNNNWDPKKPLPGSSKFPYKIFNIASNKKVKLMDYIKLIEKYLSKKAKIKKLPLQKGDVINVSSNINKISNTFNYKPKTNVKIGVKNFIDWYLKYYNK